MISENRKKALREAVYRSYQSPDGAEVRHCLEQFGTDWELIRDTIDDMSGDSDEEENFEALEYEFGLQE